MIGKNIWKTRNFSHYVCYVLCAYLSYLSSINWKQQATLILRIKMTYERSALVKNMPSSSVAANKMQSILHLMPSNWLKCYLKHFRFKLICNFILMGVRCSMDFTKKLHWILSSSSAQLVFFRFKKSYYLSNQKSFNWSPIYKLKGKGCHSTSII